MLYSPFAKVVFFCLLAVAVAPLWAQQQAKPASLLTGMTPATRLYFEPNNGQLDAEVLYLARAPGYRFFLTAREAVWRLHERWPDSAKRHPDVVIRLRLAPATHIEAQGRLKQVSHYYLGRDPRHWHHAVPAYERILYEEVYPGIDVVFYGRDSLLEYDFRLDPGADPGAIDLDFSGVDQLRVDEGGNLILQQGETRLVHHRPLAYQEVDGQNKPVAAAYQVAQGKVTFRLAEYDPKLPLIIDPSVTFSSYLGGSAEDEANSVTADTAGNSYVTGRTTSLDFPGVGSSLVGDADAFVSKFDADGNLLFSAYLGGVDGIFTNVGDRGRGIVVDSAGQIYITGDADTAFPVTTGAYDVSWNGTRTDAFVAVLDASGNLVYSSYLGGNGADEGHGIAVDSGGDIYVTGQTRSSDFPNKNAFSPAYGGIRDAFLVKLRPAGNGAADLLYASYFGGSGAETGLALALQGSDQVYMGGSTNSSGLATSAVYQTSLVGNDAFVAHFDTAQTGAASLVAATYLHGTESGPAVSVNGLAMDTANNVYAAGSTQTATFPLTADALDGQFGGNSEAFVALLSADLQQLLYASFLGGSGDEEGASIAVDDSNRLYITGNTKSADFPGTGDNITAFPYGGGLEGFLVAMDSGRGLRYALYLGGAGDDAGRGVAVDATDNAYVAGVTGSVDFLPLVSPAIAALQGIQDAFVLRIVDASSGTNGGSGGSGGSGGGITITEGDSGSPSSGSGGGGGLLFLLPFTCLPRLWSRRSRAGCASFIMA